MFFRKKSELFVVFMNPEQVFSKEMIYVHINSQIYKTFTNEAQWLQTLVFSVAKSTSVVDKHLFVRCEVLQKMVLCYP